MRPILVVCALLFLWSAPATADLARELSWRDLVPGGEALADPLAHLTGDQRLDLEAVAWARAAERRGEISSVSEEYEIAVEMTNELTQQGLDVDALVEEYESFREQVDALNRRVDDGLDGKLVRIPGFALPLEFSGIAVKEFLLVPYFGACIHVPPPPPNQMVLVALDEPYVVNELFAPVWITGRMSVKRSTTSLAYVDGRASLETGYTLAGTRIEPYER